MINILILLIIVGVVVALVPMDATIKRVVVVLAIVFALLVLLRHFAVV